MIPIQLTYSNQTIFLFIFQSRIAYSDLIHQRNKTYGVFSTRLIEQIITSQGNQSGMAIVRFHTHIQKNQWSKHHIAFHLKYLLVPLITLLISLMIAFFFSFLAIEYLYLFMILLITISEILFIFVGWLDKEYITKNGLKKMMYILNNQYVLSDTLKEYFEWTEKVAQNAIHSISGIVETNSSKYWARRSGTLTLNEILEHERNLRLILEEY